MSSSRLEAPADTLIVDDVQRLRRLVADELDSADSFRVIGEAANGREAIEQAKTLEPDLVLLDLSMPRMDGLEALSEIRRRIPGVEVVVLSGFTSERMAAIARDQGALDYVEKGLDPGELTARLEGFVNGDTGARPAPDSPNTDSEATRDTIHVCTVSLDPATAEKLASAIDSARSEWQTTRIVDPPRAVPEAADAILVAAGDCRGECEPTVGSLAARHPATPVVVAVDGVTEGCFEAALRAGASDVVDLATLDAQALARGIRWAILEDERDRSRTRRLEMLAGTMAHDLRGPLRALDRYADWVREGLEEGDTERVETALEGIHDGVDRARRLIDSQLDYAQVKTKPPAMQATDPRGPVEEVVDELGDRIEATDARIEVGPLPRVLAPPEHLEMLFRNLVSNAIKYHAEDDTPRIEIDGDQRDSEVLLHVRDDGIGIPEKHQDEIFDPFSRLHAEQDYPGTGMGLAICREIVDQCGGGIEVDSEPGEGTTMTVRLPAADAS